MVYFIRQGYIGDFSIIPRKVTISTRDPSTASWLPYSVIPKYLNHQHLFFSHFPTFLYFLFQPNSTYFYFFFHLFWTLNCPNPWLKMLSFRGVRLGIICWIKVRELFSLCIKVKLREKGGSSIESSVKVDTIIHVLTFAGWSTPRVKKEEDVL